MQDRCRNIKKLNKFVGEKGSDAQEGKNFPKCTGFLEQLNDDEVQHY